MKYILFITAFTLLISCKKTTTQPTTTAQISTIEFHPPSWIIGNWASASSAQIGNYTAFGFTFLKDDVQQVNGTTNSLKTLLNNTNVNNGSIVAKIDNEISNSTDYSFKEILSSVTANYYFKKIDANTMMFYTSNPSLPNVIGVKMIRLNSDLSGVCEFYYGNGVTDIDGNNYKTIVIGIQEWMQENLKVTKYTDGSQIPNIKDLVEWYNLKSNGYCYYNNNLDYSYKYGNLYNGYVISDKKGICPSGWHVPSQTEWGVLIDKLGGGKIAGGKMKEQGEANWNLMSEDGKTKTQNVGADNSSGFTALPAGGRFNGIGNGFWGVNSTTQFWSSTSGVQGNFVYKNYTSLNVGSSSSGNTGLESINNGVSIRCIKD
jgi:uncharacterized protein (TIGR02145 family)